MTCTVLWSKSAKKSLDKIVAFYELISDTNTANKIAQDIINFSISLNKLPHRCQTEPLLSHLSVEYRYLVIGNHKVIFSINNQTHTVLIHTVFDCRQNPAKLEAGI